MLLSSSLMLCKNNGILRLSKQVIQRNSSFVADLGTSKMNRSAIVMCARSMASIRSTNTFYEKDRKSSGMFGNGYNWLDHSRYRAMHQNNFSTSAEEKQEERREKAKEQVGKIKALITNYGPVGIGVYGGIYVGSLGLLFALINGDVIGAGDALSLIKYTGIDNFIDIEKISPRTGNFALAWILTKVIEPLRLVLAISLTPSVARALGRTPKNTEN